MTPTLDHLLTLAGRLDDASAFDSGRERFRRFLLEYARDWSTVRGLIGQCEHVPDDQHRRALQDLIVASGQFLGFHTTFGSIGRPPEDAHAHGTWQSRSHLQLTVEVKSNNSPADLDGLRRSVTAASPEHPGTAPGGPASPPSRRAGLCVLGPLFMHRDAVDDAAASGAATAHISVTTLTSLLLLTDMVTSGRVNRTEAVRLLESNLSLDFVVGLMDDPVARPAIPVTAEPARTPVMQDTSTASAPAPAAHVPAAAQTFEEPRYWLAPVTPDQATGPEEFLDVVVARRRTFGVAEPGGSGMANDGDYICFYIAGKGVVGQARVAGIADNGGGLRNPHRFQQILRLQDMSLSLSAPVPLDPESQLRLRTAQLKPAHGQTLVRISRESFFAMNGADDVPMMRAPRLSGG